jgi:microcystin degradation protein MlrC
LKSTVHFRGDFQVLAEEILIAIAPGGHLADSSKFALCVPKTSSGCDAALESPKLAR